MRIFIIVCLCVIFFDLLILSLFCRIEEKLDERRKRKVSCDSKMVENLQSTKNNRNYLKAMYRFLYPYMYGWLRYSTVIFGKIPSNRIRNFLYRFIFNMKITKNSVIGGGEIRSPWNIKADRVIITTPFILDGRNGIDFGQDVVLGSGVHIWTEEHDLNDPYFRVLEKNRQGVVIGKHCWICSDTTILPGVCVAEGTVLASRACLTRGTEAFGVYAGIPARKIGNRNDDLKYILDGKPSYHFY